MAEDKNKKVIIGISILAVAAIIGYILYKKHKDNAAQSNTALPDATKTAASTNATQSSDSANTSSNVTQSKSSNSQVDATLPNKGANCSSVKTDFDGDYDYVKCGTDWWTRSKANPKTAAAKNSIPNWKTLKGNTVAANKLNAKYPNG